jgi:hypothetical protein
MGKGNQETQFWSPHFQRFLLSGRRVQTNPRYRFPLCSSPAGGSFLQSCVVCLFSGAGRPHSRGQPSRFAASISHIVPAVRTLLASFPSIDSDGKGTPRPRHGVRHFVGRPVFAKDRRLDPDKLKIAEAEFRSLEAAEIVRRSNSPWSSPLHMVPKADGSWRPCGDYRCLNTVTTPDRYPLPSMLDLSAKLHGCKFFSCVDLVKVYH